MDDPLRLNLRHLRALPLIVRHGSMSAAAGEIGLTQPALAQGIAKIETALGARLFLRRPDGMSPTPAGTAVAMRGEIAWRRLRTAMRRIAPAPFEVPENLITATQLRAFLSVADAGGFAGAARRSGSSQPAIHRAVGTLQQIAGSALLERQGRHIGLTGHGRLLARAIRLAAADLLAAIDEARAERGGGRITVGAMPLSRAHLLPDAIARSMRDDPAIRFDVAEGSFAELVEPLRDGSVDLLVGAMRDPPPPDLRQTFLLDDPLVVVARSGHPLARIGAPTPGDLAACPWIVGRAGSPLRALWEQLFADWRLPRPAAPIECGSVLVIRGVLADSDCLTLLSPAQVRLEMRAGLFAEIALPGLARHRQIGIITRADWLPTRTQQRFLDTLAEIAGEAIVPKSE